MPLFFTTNSKWQQVLLLEIEEARSFYTMGLNTSKIDYAPALYIDVAGGRNVGPIYKQMFSTSMIGIQIFKSYKKVPMHTRRTI